MPCGKIRAGLQDRDKNFGSLLSNTASSTADQGTL